MCFGVCHLVFVVCCLNFRFVGFLVLGCFAGVAAFGCFRGFV